MPVTIDFRRRSVKAVVVGGGSWGTGFSRLLADRGYEVTLATHSAEDARGDPRDRPQPALPDARST